VGWILIFFLNSNEFLKDCPQVYIGAKVSRATIVGNIWLGAERIENHSSGSIVVGLNANGGVAVDHPIYKPRKFD